MRFADLASQMYVRRTTTKIALSVWIFGAILTYLILNLTAIYSHFLLRLGLLNMVKKLQEWLLQFLTAGYLSLKIVNRHFQSGSLWLLNRMPDFGCDINSPLGVHLFETSKENEQRLYSVRFHFTGLDEPITQMSR